MTSLTFLQRNERTSRETDDERAQWLLTERDSQPFIRLTPRGWEEDKKGEREREILSLLQSTQPSCSTLCTVHQSLAILLPPSATMNTQTHTHANAHKVLLAAYISSTKSYNKAHSHKSGLYKRSASDNHWCRHGVLCRVLMREILISFFHTLDYKLHFFY